ncbi:MAG: hypothetical protein AAGA81_19165 [Acidobacteriota bacterium]
MRSPLEARRRLLGRAFVIALAITALAWTQKGDLPAVGDLRPEMLQEPVQVDVEAPPFHFEYKGQKVEVQPVADYEMWGLVVSHNNIQSIADIYHDSSSVDTKDLCVVWGESLRNGSYLDVDFWSGPWTCYFRYSAGNPFQGRDLGNNHMITGSAALRDQLANVRIGDQIRVRGRLVNYRMEDWRDWWRRSSTNRDDAGNGACEVIYFDQIDTLQAGTPLWYLLFRLGVGLLIVVPLFFVHSLWIDAGRSRQDLAPETPMPAEMPDVWTGEVESS